MVEWSLHTTITNKEAIIRDYHDHITVESERKCGQHLGQEERGAVEQLKKLGYSLRSIAAKLNCSASTVLNELRRGPTTRKSAKGRRPQSIPLRIEESPNRQQIPCLLFSLRA